MSKVEGKAYFDSDDFGHKGVFNAELHWDLLEMAENGLKCFPETSSQRQYYKFVRDLCWQRLFDHNQLPTSE